MSCIFCSIIKRETPAEILYEDKALIAFKDIYPKAPVHILIVPKKHLSSLNEIVENEVDLMGQLIYRAKLLAEEQGIAKSGYKLVFNCGRDAGQIMDHIHLHLLGGASLRRMV